MELVTREVATEEINLWLESKKIGDKKRQSYKDHIETLVDAIVEGNLVYDTENHKLTQKLKFPFSSEGKATITDLSYKNRVSSRDVEPYLKNVKAGDADNRLVGWICALTESASGIIKALDSEDLSLGQSIAIFFL